MFMNVRKISVLIVVLTAILTILTSLLFLKPENGPVLAQGGGGDVGEMSIVPAAGGIDSQSDGSGVEVVPIGAFRNVGENPDGWTHTVGGYIANASASQVCFAAPTYPPDGATITQFRIVLMDDNAANDLPIFLYRVLNTNTSLTGSQVMGGGAVTNQDNGSVIEAFTASIANPVVSKAYSYYVYFCFPASVGQEMRFYGARIVYTP